MTSSTALALQYRDFAQPVAIRRRQPRWSRIDEANDEREREMNYYGVGSVGANIFGWIVYLFGCLLQDFFFSFWAYSFDPILHSFSKFDPCETSISLQTLSSNFNLALTCLTDLKGSAN